jgi:hypothetical protein
MKQIFWLSQVALVFSALYFSPLLSPVISSGKSMDEWSVRQSEHKEYLILERSEGHSYRKRHLSCSKAARGLPSFEFPDGKFKEVIDYNVETFVTNARP